MNGQHRHLPEITWATCHPRPACERPAAIGLLPQGIGIRALRPLLLTMQTAASRSPRTLARGGKQSGGSLGEDVQERRPRSGITHPNRGRLKRRPRYGPLRERLDRYASQPATAIDDGTFAIPGPHTDTAG